MPKYNTIFLLCLLATLAVSIAEIFFISLGNDTLNLILFSLRFLQHGILYERWLEMNPPLIILYYAIPAAGLLYAHIPVAISLRTIVVLLCAISVVRIDKELLRGGVSLRKRRMCCVASLFILFLLPSLCMDFGDREHLLFAFALPWMLARVLGLQPTRTSMVFAMLGFLIKPYNLLFFFILQFFTGPKNQSFKDRLFSSHVAIAALMAGIYALVTYLYFPAYLFQMVPLARISYPILYYSYVYKSFILISFTFFTLSLMYLGHKRGLIISTQWIVFLGTAACVYLLNGGWTYTTYLFLVPSMFICIALIEASVRPDFSNINHLREVRTFAVLMVLIVIGFSIGNLVANIFSTQKNGHPLAWHHMPEKTTDALYKAIGEDNFILLSTSLWGTNLTGLDKPPTSVLGFDYLWTLPWLLEHPNAPEVPYVRAITDNAFLTALYVRPAPMVIVDISPFRRGIHKDMDILGYFLENAEIRRTFTGYQQIQVIDGCDADETIRCRFSIWKKPLHQGPTP